MSLNSQSLNILRKTKQHTRKKLTFQQYVTSRCHWLTEQIKGSNHEVSLSNAVSRTDWRIRVETNTSWGTDNLLLCHEISTNQKWQISQRFPPWISLTYKPLIIANFKNSQIFLNEEFLIIEWVKEQIIKQFFSKYFKILWKPQLKPENGEREGMLMEPSFSGADVSLGTKAGLHNCKNTTKQSKIKIRKEHRNR